MAEQESEHGKLNAVDQTWTGPRFMALLFASLLVAMSIIYTIASIKSGNFGWQPLAHDPIKHTLESSTIGH